MVKTTDSQPNVQLSPNALPKISVLTPLLLAPLTSLQHVVLVSLQPITWLILAKINVMEKCPAQT